MWEWERYFQYGSPRKMLTHTQSGLIHTSKMGRSGGKLEVRVFKNFLLRNLIWSVMLEKDTSNDTLQVGQRVEVKVLNIDIAKGRIGLELVKLLWTRKLNTQFLPLQTLHRFVVFSQCVLSPLITKTPGIAPDPLARKLLQLSLNCDVNKALEQEHCVWLLSAPTGALYVVMHQPLFVFSLHAIQCLMSATSQRLLK